jgi:hypothetical protein
MQSSETNNLTPQTEEGITEIIWLEKKEWNKIHENTFKSISEVLNSL